MLCNRILIIAVLFFVAGTLFAEPLYKEPDEELMEKNKSLAESTFNEVDTILKDGTVDKVLTRERLNILNYQRSRGFDTQMPSFLESERNERYLASALTGGRTLETSSMSEVISPVVLISFSMPENQIRNLIVEANLIGASVAIRGLVDNDFKKTLLKVKHLAGESGGGIQIDPTLFKRFESATVPMFILPLEPLKQCTDQECPIPRHVKATGSATIKYFLDLVARTGDEYEKSEAKAWLAKYGE